MKRLMDRDIHVVEKTKWFALISLVIALIAVVLMVTRGMNIGIDFTGGATIEFELGDKANDGEFKKTFEQEMKEILKENYSVSDQMQVSPNGAGYTLSLRLNYYFNGEYNGVKCNGALDKNSKNSAAEHSAFIDSLSNKADGGMSKILYDKAVELYKAVDSEYTADDISQVIRITDVGATASNTLISSAIWAIVVALVVILVYIVIRFTFLSGIASILALFHDVIIMVALTTIFYIPVNSTFIAAVITIIGYSINASIVIFDKIRECIDPNNSAFQMASDTEVANYAIKHSFMKIFLSTVTTLIMVVAVVLFSVATIQEFVLPIIFGLISGLFSALCLSPTLWVLFRKWDAKRKAKKKA